MGLFYNLARMTTATIGQGTITLVGAATVNGVTYLTFDQAGVPNGTTVSYGISDSGASEVGQGVYNSSAKTLTRAVTKSTNNNSAINLSGSAQVFLMPRAEDIGIGSPIFILATGQSNFVNSPSYAWTPARNLLVWNNTVNTDGSVGTAFATPDATVANAATMFASNVAAAYWNSTVYLLNVSFNSQAIAHWKTGASSPDVYANINLNISAALAAANVTKIDALLWWQGDSDRAASTNYLTDFETVMSRFESETWCPPSTPKIVWGIASSATGGDSNFDPMNAVLAACVAAQPDRRLFVYPPTFSSSYWATNHMTGVGYDLAGKMIANAFLFGTGRQTVDQIVVQPSTRNIGFGAIPGKARLTVSKASSVQLSTPTPYEPTPNDLDALAHFVGADGYSNVTTIDAFGTGSVPWLALRAARGTQASPTAIQSGDFLFVLSGAGYGATLYSGPLGEVRFKAIENFTDSAQGTSLEVQTTPSGSTTRVTQLTLGSDTTAYLPSADKRDSTAHFRSFDGYSAVITVDAYGTNAVPWFAGRASRGTQSSPTATQSGDFLTVLSGAGYGATGIGAPTGEIRFKATEAFTDAHQGTSLEFQITPTGSTTRQTEVTIDSNGLSCIGKLLTSSPTQGIGYTTGAGGTVTQSTNKSTAVTLNTLSGQITMNNASLADATNVRFTVDNTTINAKDCVIVNHASAGTAGAYQVSANNIGDGISFDISVRNVSGGALSEAIVLNFIIIKGA